MADAQECLSEHAQSALDRAEQDTRRRGHGPVDADHILLSLLHNREYTAVRILSGLGVDIAELRNSLSALLDKPGTNYKGIGRTRRTRRVLELADRERLRMRQPLLGTEHLLLGIIREGGGEAVRFLANRQVNLENVRAELRLLNVAEARRAIPPEARENRPRIIHRVYRMRWLKESERSEHRFVKAVNAAIAALGAVEADGLAADLGENVIIAQLRLLQSMVVFDQPRAVRRAPDDVDVDLVLDVIHRAAEVYLKHGQTVAGLALRDVEAAIRSTSPFKTP